MSDTTPTVDLRTYLNDRLRILNELSALAGKFHERGDIRCSAEMTAILDSRLDLSECSGVTD